MASLKRSDALLILSAVISVPIFSTMSFVSLRNRASGDPMNVIVHRGVNEQTKDVMAPPNKTTPTAEAASAKSFATIAKIILCPGKKDFKMLMKVGEAKGTSSVCFSVGIKNPSKACPAKPDPYWLTYC